MKFRLRISKRTRFLSHLMASVAFIGLFIWGWGLSVDEATLYLLICVACVVGLVGVAAILGLLLRLIRSRFEATNED